MSAATRGRPERGVRLSKILERPRFVACDDMLARSCQDDPDRCRPGDVFVARTTRSRDGHEAVARAVSRGAVGIVAERIVAAGGVPLCLVPDADRAHARLCHALAGDPAARLELIAVTGTSGKTTAAWLTAAVLSEAGGRVGVLADIGCLDAEGTVPEPADYGPPAALAAWLGRLADADCTHAVVEVSREMLARQSLAGIEAGIVAVTNLAPGRGRHEAMRAQSMVTDRVVGMLGPEGCLVTGTPSAAIDRLRKRVARGVPGVACVSSGLRPECDLHAIPVERGLAGQIFLLRAGGETVPVAVATPTASFVADALVAAAVGLRCGATLERIARGLEAAGSVPGRMERLDRGQDLPVFLDAPTSGHALAATVRSLRRLTAGRLAVVADERWARAVGKGIVRHLARRCDECVVVPATMLAEEAEPADVAAYARLDRLLGGLGRRDCLLVLGAPRLGSGPAGGPDDGEHSLAAAVDGWLQLANPPRPPVGRRAA